MTMNHTPGRWRVSADGDEVTTSPVGILESSKTICRTSSHYRSDEECRANACLIAAAPDMLAVLKLIVEQITHEANAEHTLGAFSLGARIAEAREAIAKATGAA